MSTYVEFERKLLLAAFQYSELTSEQMPTVQQIVDYYALEYKDSWLDRALEKFRTYGYNRDKGHLGGGFLGQHIWLSASGYAEAERLRDVDGVWVPTPAEAKRVEEFLNGGAMNVDVAASNAATLNMALTSSVPSASTSPTFLSSSPSIDSARPAGDSSWIHEQAAPVEKSFDSTSWTGTQFIVTDARVIVQIKQLSCDLKSALDNIHIPSNSAREDLYVLVDALIAICGMAEPEISIIDRITASPKFKMFAGLVVLVATIRSATGL